MFKLAVGFFLWRWLTVILGNPLVAILVLIAVYYLIDRRYIGLLPNLGRPFSRWRRASELRRQLDLNPHDADARHELARIYLAQHRHQACIALLQQLPDSLRNSPDVLYEEGLCRIGLGEPQAGEGLIRQAVHQQPNLFYGEPYLRLASLHAVDHPEQALADLRLAQQYNQSSCEAWYRLATLYRRLGDHEQAQRALHQCIHTYRALPAFRRRQERRWFVLARLSTLGRALVPKR
ncbi:tetratricopeptide repeat protein [Alicyclobacillus macrosporangiidus]|uniref:tetratricopeptide repeat protein n=1 Tax=Alicyclobacillus macrosporangiidus TaxID=392015 RepID=UPI000497C2CC|nr:tetratricopeptide repeat protein [Alicyclobacillus macrosporangiidus]